MEVTQYMGHSHVDAASVHLVCGEGGGGGG